MDQNDKNNKNRRGRNSNLAGAAKLVAWALALTVVFYCTNSYMGTAGKQASSINIKYSLVPAVKVSHSFTLSDPANGSPVEPSESWMG